MSIVVQPSDAGFTATMGLVRANLFFEVFTADQTFRPLPRQLIIPENTTTESSVSFHDDRIVNGFKHFVRFLTESGGLFSGETDFFQFIPVVSSDGNLLQENGVDHILQEDGSLILQEGA